MNDIDRIQEFIRIQRKYASFFEWYNREKSIKEKGVVESLLESLSRQSATSYQNIRASTNDPPDILAETLDGGLVGFEVRELVDQEVIELNEKGKEVYRNWTTSEVIHELQKIIKEKDIKSYLGGPYEKLILVIPTAEPVLTPLQLKPFLDIHVFDETNKLQEAYLLFQYDSATKGYPYIKLRIR